MRRGQGERVPIPTDEDLRGAISLDRVIVACSGKRYGPLIVLTVALHNGDISTVALDVAGGFRLLRALKALIPDGPSVGAASLTGDGVQEGNMSA